MMSPFWKSAIFGGLVGGLVCVVIEIGDAFLSDFIDLLLCLSLPLCGVLAIRHYMRVSAATVSGGLSVGLGAVSGAIAGVLISLTISVLMLTGVEPGVDEVRAYMPEFDDRAGRYIEMVLRYLHWILLLTLAGFGSVLGLAGSALGWSLLRDKHGKKL